MHYILKEMGIKNNMFFLQLYDESLADIDPLDEDSLTPVQKTKVHIEISKNPWYYYREIVKIPMTDIKSDFELTRGTLAILWSLHNNLKAFIVLPRQCYKSYTISVFYSWLIYWGAKNFNGAFFAQNAGLATQNLSRVKDIRESLPKYLNLKSNMDTDNVQSIVYRPGDYTNTIMTKAPGMNEEAANNVGRGMSTMGQWYDEIAFIPYIWTQYGAAVPAYSTVSKIAEVNGSPHHIVMSTTAGNKRSQSGKWAHDFMQSSAPFTEHLYDMVEYDNFGNVIGFDKLAIREYITYNNTGQHFLRIEYSWDELSKPVTYLEEMKALMPGLDEFNRGVLNIWSDSSEDHPLGHERVKELMTKIRQPEKVVMVDKIYVLKYYRDPEQCKIDSKHIVFGMDVGGNVRRDYSTLVGLDVTNSEVVCTLRVNQYSINRFARAVAYILLYLFPESVLVGERNSIGTPVLETIYENGIRSSRIYLDEEKDQRGVFMDKNIRALFYGDILRISILEHGHKIYDSTIIGEIADLIMTKSGRIDHAPDGHDDLLIAYLYTRWFVMFCKTKGKYIDNIYFNSRLDQFFSEDDLMELNKTIGKRAQMDFVMGNKYGVVMKEDMKEKLFNNDWLSNRIKGVIDENINSHRNVGADIYIDNFDITPIIKEQDIHVDTVADSYIDDYPEYTGDINVDDPEKIQDRTEEIRDTSGDPINMFAINFKV